MEKSNGILAEDMILAVASLFNGKSEKKICEELTITPLILNKWLKMYGEIGYQYNKLETENEWLRKKVIDLSLNNQALNETIQEMRGNADNNSKLKLS